ncbi:MAG: 3-deoxy-7-phosphoheptulonate synthase class II [Planctomycetes bacterium]|jgi:3-deoxy-7-phosphoheptulonate synthase|nr:3-deoxy-7-phosphoheptulonate synthase class II [Planctomycetota bacterium]MCP4838241.1 3-deoxy-7-phosphoheptulonate synthase class II [Planctomycetota bacterium]
MSDWTSESWKSKPVRHQPEYPDAKALAEATEELASFPPLVTSWEIEVLKQQLGEAATGHRFLLQGGDCAESFAECTSSVIINKLKILLQMSLVLVHGTHRRVIRVGRFAGQYAKPRSDPMETRDGVSMPSYYGDIVNRPAFESKGRMPDPWRMLRGYERSALTLNFIRSLIDGGFADLHHPEYWELNFVEHSPKAAEFHAIVESIGESLRFMETLSGISVADISRVDFYTSHEGLLLPYEAALTREVPRRKGWYNLSTHFPWIGMRTAGLDDAHVEFFRGIRNPIAIKMGPSLKPRDMQPFLNKLIDTLHPDDEPGRLTFIHRYGAERVAEYLPALIEGAKATGRTVLFVCDPMHGNTRKTEAGIKTRRFDDILMELEQAIEIHQACGSNLGGVHFELTGENVTECTGGARGLTDDDLKDGYRSLVDPRLNYEQALEMAMLIARRLSAKPSSD